MNELILKLIRKFKTNDPFQIAKGLNIHIRYANFDDGTRGLYYRVLRRRFIVIHDQLDEHWQRFVCAHELAHDRLHPGFNRFWLDEQSFFNAGKFERQANKFAVRLLTAGDSPRRGETIGEVLRRNGVPEEMAKFYL
ncbi:ImmA/IrrE family metallo-endopeptidase [Paenibacillus naphthalenovorans]|uniref:ImmA/IrrE family metallo-endopeptidase n=1 Tax=Paenibacillus naphthalenovorans TaxID=162209 RepID=UPI003D2D8D60